MHACCGMHDSSRVSERARLWTLKHRHTHRAACFPCRCLVTAGSDQKCAQCMEMGAHAAINYKEHNFPDEVHKIEKVPLVALISRVLGPGAG